MPSFDLQLTVHPCVSCRPHDEQLGYTECVSDISWPNTFTRLLVKFEIHREFQWFLKFNFRSKSIFIALICRYVFTRQYFMYFYLLYVKNKWYFSWENAHIYLLLFNCTQNIVMIIHGPRLRINIVKKIISSLFYFN